MSADLSQVLDLPELLGVEEGEAPDPTVEALLPAPGKNGRRATRAAVRTVLQHDPRLQSRVRFDSFAERLLLGDEPITDAELTRLNCWLEEVYQLTPSRDLLAEVVGCVADEARVHPVRAWLEGLRWDGEPRLPSLLHRALSAEDTPLHAAYGVCALVAAVARVLSPGCKVDALLVLVGGQGVGKSRFCAALLPDPRWFGDTPLDLRSKDAYGGLRGKWIYEIAEMEAFRGSNAAQVKAFVSSPCDHYRAPYARFAVDVPRQCVFIGTSNDPELLTDPTGSRRFWPVRVDALDLDWLQAHRDALWAEALHRYRAGQPWHLDAAQEAERVAVAEQFTRTDPHRERLEAWLPTVTRPFTTAEAVMDGLGMARASRSLETRLGSLLRQLGCEKSRVRDALGRRWVWVPPAVAQPPPKSRSGWARLGQGQNDDPDDGISVAQPGPTSPESGAARPEVGPDPPRRGGAALPSRNETKRSETKRSETAHYPGIPTKTDAEEAP